MTTDRPTATRATALPQRHQAGSADRSQAGPSDAFSALLGAAAPRPADAPRPEARPRRDDSPRADEPNARPATDKPAPKDEQPKADEPKTDPTAATEEPADPKPRLTPDIFALQLASPLPTTPIPVTPATTPQAVATAPAEGEAAPAIPVFPQLNNLLTGVLPGQPGPDAPVADAAPAVAPGTPGGIPLPFLAGLTPASQTDVPKIELPVTPPTDVPVDVAAPQLDAAALPNPGGEQAGSDTPQQQSNPQATATTATATAKPAEQPAAPATTAAQPVVQAAPIAQAAPMQHAGGLQRAVPLYRAPESAAHLIQIAAERGITHAKLNLKPVELGGIEVRLQTTPHGVTAQLVADSPEAAKLLTQAADDLRRDLADRDVNLLSLDVTTQQQYQEQQAGSKQADIFGDRLDGARNVRVGLHGDAGLTESPAPADTTLVLPNGVLVDVLA